MSAATEIVEMITWPSAMSPRSGRRRLVRPERSVSQATASPTRSTAYPASGASTPNSSTAAEQTIAAGTSPIGCVRTWGAAMTVATGTPQASQSRWRGARRRGLRQRSRVARGCVGGTCHDRSMTRMPHSLPYSASRAAIVPPYLLARIAATDDPRFDRASEAALRSLQRDAPLREWRREGALPSFIAHEQAARDERPAALPGQAPAPDRRISDAQNNDTLPG